MNAEFVVGVLEVLAHCARGDLRQAGHLGVRPPLRHQLEDLALPRGEPPQPSTPTGRATS
jgi:hypothetical protein